MLYDYGTIFTLCVLHNNHQSLVFQEVFVVLYDVWMGQHGQNFDLVQSCLPLLLRHLFDRNLFDNHMLLIRYSPTEVYSPA